MKPMPIDASGLSDRGRERDSNDDQFVLADLGRSMTVQASSLQIADRTHVPAPRRAHLMLVADGLGGHPQGELASSLVAGEACRIVLEQFPVAAGEAGAAEVGTELLDLVRHCEAEVAARAQSDADRKPGTTLTLAFLTDETLHAVHVGDTRLYTLRGDVLEQLTTDHTTPATGDPQAHGASGRGRLWNAVGGNDKPAQTELLSVDARGLDAILLCSDGLTRHLDDDAIAKVITSSRDSQAACRALVERANALGGKDNVTVVVAYLRDAESSQRATGHDDGSSARASADLPAQTPRDGGQDRLEPRLPDGGWLGGTAPMEPRLPRPGAPTGPLRRTTPPVLESVSC